MSLILMAVPEEYQWNCTVNERINDGIEKGIGTKSVNSFCDLCLLDQLADILIYQCNNQGYDCIF